MALIDGFFRQTVKIKPYIREASGGPVYGDEEERRCRLQRGQNLRTVHKNADGQIDETIADTKMFCTGAAIPERSIVTYEEREYIVLKCRVLNGFQDSHLEVYLE